MSGHRGFADGEHCRPETSEEAQEARVVGVLAGQDDNAVLGEQASHRRSGAGVEGIDARGRSAWRRRASSGSREALRDFSIHFAEPDLEQLTQPDSGGGRHDHDDAVGRIRAVESGFQEPGLTVGVDAEVEQAVMPAAQREVAASCRRPHAPGEEPDRRRRSTLWSGLWRRDTSRRSRFGRACPRAFEWAYYWNPSRTLRAADRPVRRRER